MHLSTLKVAVVGAGWAGCAAAVRACRAGHQVTLFELAAQPGGRARGIDVAGWPSGTFDNGQHILVGAYGSCLSLLAEVGVPVSQALLRIPLELRYPDGRGLAWPGAEPAPAGRPASAWQVALGAWDALRGLANFTGWSWRDRTAMLSTATGWSLQRYTCPADWTVARLTRHLPVPVRRDFINPLCVAALNTPAIQASAQVFLRVLRDTLLGGRGASDLLLPRLDLGRLFPMAAVDWLRRHAATVRLGCRVESVQADAGGWRIRDERFDAAILACPPWEAARLVEKVAPAWAGQTQVLQYEPIATVYARGEGLPRAMLALPTLGDPAASPAQFVFDRGRLDGPSGLLAFVISGAAPWVARGLEATRRAVVRQAARDLGQQVEPVQTVVEKRATFLCRPAMRRPAMQLAPGLLAAGDYVDGPYPATLEGAVRSGIAAAQALSQPAARTGAEGAPQAAAAPEGISL